MWTEFKKFAMRGNVVDLAVGVIIGAAFGGIVSSLVNDIISEGLGALVEPQVRLVHQAILSVTGGGDPTKARPGMSQGVPQKVLVEKLKEELPGKSQEPELGSRAFLLTTQSAPRSLAGTACDWLDDHGWISYEEREPWFTDPRSDVIGWG